MCGQEVDNRLKSIHGNARKIIHVVNIENNTMIPQQFELPVQYPDVKLTASFQLFLSSTRYLSVFIHGISGWYWQPVNVNEETMGPVY